VWNLVSHPKGSNQSQGVLRTGVEENIWTYEKGSNRREGRKTYIMRSFISCTLNLLHIVRVINSRRTIWVEHVAYIKAMWNWYKILVENPQGKWPVARARHKWDNTEIDLRRMGCEMDSNGPGLGPKIGSCTPLGSTRQGTLWPAEQLWTFQARVWSWYKFKAEEIFKA